MGDDVTVVVPSDEPEPELDAIGMELVNLLQGCQSRIDELVLLLGEQSGRITSLEFQLTEYGAREYALLNHGHEGLAEAGHGHAEYALSEHTHAEGRKKREPDRPPENQHWYFKRLGD